MKIVDKIIDDVRKKGDYAVRYYTKKFDSIDLDSFIVTEKEIAEAYNQVDKDTIKAIKFAKNSIERFAKRQMQQFRDFETRNNGIILGQKVVPIQKIGAYIPGGKYPLPSTALMCIVPARIAGVKKIIACSPKIKPETIVAANIAGADKIFKIGGVQAIAAMAYGTKSIAKVDKIVGPGNIYVTAAKKAVYGDCGIDFLAGPSEIMIIADSSSNLSFVVADLLSQLEHDENSKAYLIASSQNIAFEVKNLTSKQIEKLSTKETIKKSLKNFRVFIASNPNKIVRIANEIAPEHLELQVKNPELYIKRISNYGSLFIGSLSAEAFGDYCSGTNHVLPTDGGAKYTSGLSVRDFIKLQTYQKIKKKSVKKLAEIGMRLAKIEGLEAHRKSLEIRFNG